MKHLFIINPVAGRVRGQVDRLAGEIKTFFSGYPHLSWDIHVTRWKRDAMGFTRRYAANSEELVRVYAMGGTGTFFEVINGIMGIPNTQAAALPLGTKNSFLRYYGEKNFHFFNSLRNLMISNTLSLDVIRWGNTCGINNCLIGAEAMSYLLGRELSKKTRLPGDLCYNSCGIYYLFTGRALQHYRIQFDGEDIEGDYVSIMIANAPCYGRHMSPAIDANPRDGMLNLYLIKSLPKSKTIPVLDDYEHGRYRKWPGFISHYTTKSLSVSSDKVMSLSFDGEIFFDKQAEFTLVPGAIDMVYPSGLEPPLPERRRGNAAAKAAKTNQRAS
jgi:diacylglycerol kinase family enzyme